MVADWRAARVEVANRLAAAGIAAAESEARILVEEASGSGPDEWLEVSRQEPHARAAAGLSSMCDRRCAGEPLQYVVGSWSFRGLDLMVDSRVLIPRPETEWVVEVALEEAERAGMRRDARRPFVLAPRFHVADLGTGSGAIALALEAELPDAQVWAVDASADALAVASANIAGCAATRVRVALGSWFAPLPLELRGHFALVVSNPPYVADGEVASLPREVADYEPRDALVSGPSGFEALDHLVEEAPAWLTPGGALVCELAPHQAASVAAKAKRSGYARIEIRDDLTGRERVFVGVTPHR